MSFVSSNREFLFFLALLLPAYYLLGWGLRPRLGHRLQNLLLLCASYLFYGWWDIRFLLLIVISTVVDFCCGLMIERGTMTGGQRWRSSICLLLAAVLFAGVRWPSLAALRAEPFEWSLSLFPTPLAMWVVAGCLVAVVGAQALYPIVCGLPPRARRRLFLILSIVTNLGILGFFKYFNFFAESLVAGARQLHFNVDQPTLEILLPVGISFYTFQTLGYAIDVYRGRSQATDGFTDFMLYVGFFPQLVMGPIERAAKLLPQLSEPRRFCSRQVVSGLQLGLWGYFKKAVIADNVAEIANRVFASPEPDGWYVVVGLYAFAIQIYCDFSGYTDIARGVARMLGVELRPNFRLPYFATNPSDFWRRWHISLSTWLRDYLYIPLGGNRNGRLRTYRNLLVTMVLGGLWHGAAWNFVAWGAYHGVLLLLFQALRRGPAVEERQRRGIWFWLRVLLFFQLTCAGWLIFRAQSLAQVGDMLSAVILHANLFQIDLSKLLPLLYCAIPLIGFQVYQDRCDEQEIWSRWPAWVQTAWCLGLYYGIVLLEAPQTYPFYYFQF